MDTSGRRLGWIAIGIGVLALAVALFNRGPGIRSMAGGFQSRGAWQSQQMPQGPQGWQQGPQDQQGQRGPRGGFGNPQDGAQQGGPQWQQGPQGSPHGGFGYHQGGPQQGFMPGPGRGFGADRGGFGPPFFFWPFMIVGRLIKLALFGLLLYLGWKLLRRGRSGAAHDETRDPPPPTPPATGETTTL